MTTDTSNPPSLAERMYGETSSPAPKNEPPTKRPADVITTDAEARAFVQDVFKEEPESEPEWQPIEGSVSVDDLVNQEQSAAERMYAAGGPVPDAADGYASELAGGAFDHLEYQARYDGNDADATALAEGRTQSAAFLHEMNVPLNEAGEITRALGEWHRRDILDEGQLIDAKGRAVAQLEKEWGKEAAARFELAQRTAREACKRMPWLSDLLAAGAGNDPALIKRFAEIGLRNARKTKR